MNIPEYCDVVVIGGGPAGSMVGTLLSQKGYDVVLLERQKHPRPHVGESLIPHFWKYCDMVQVSDKIAAEGFIQKAGGTVVWNEVIRQMRFKDFGYSRPALHVERDRFDQIFSEHAKEQGVQVFEPVLASHVDLGQKTGVTYRLIGDKTEGKITCRFIVDASGQNAVIAKQLGIRVVDECFRFASLWGYFKNSKYVAFDGQIHPNEDLSSIPPTTFVSSIKETGDWGWSWHIPLRESTSVGLVLPVEFMKTVKAGGESWEAHFHRQCHNIPRLKDLLENAQFCEGSFAAMQDYSYRSTQIAGPGFFLIGDAAAFIDPIFSIGIVLSFYSAYLASWAIDRCLKNPNEVARYQAMYTDQLVGRMEMVRSLALPRYQPGEPVDDLAKSTVQFESTVERELMDVVSTMTTRSDNFHAIMADENVPKVTSKKFNVLEKIV
ncbi:FAD binding domain protein [Candidatus Thiomargarita nelsonii]|uniref:FAD binding domain protein n=1 Tax=Candidatus Thiomargarita nelsonii TaxID=1003181 RepID=A0A176RUI2_9GAMM|nr:FAD binding domain protein [Candidatus Thiomargarita nelsonii]